MNDSLFAAGLGALAIAIFAGILGPALDEAAATTASLHDAQIEAQRRARFDRAVTEMCGGENSAHVLLADGSVQCFTKRGKATRKVTP